MPSSPTSASLPPVDNELPDSSPGPLLRFVALLDAKLIPAHVIDHDSDIPKPIEPSATAEYGEYLSFLCVVCHGRQLDGGGGAPDITRSGAVGRWSEAGFVTAMRTGVTPGGGTIDSNSMPWENLARMTDEELRAIWLYLQSLGPGGPSGTIGPFALQSFIENAAGTVRAVATIQTYKDPETDQPSYQVVPNSFIYIIVPVADESVSLVPTDLQSGGHPSRRTTTVRVGERSLPGFLMESNMPDEFKQEGLEIVFSGTVGPAFPIEGSDRILFELTKIAPKRGP